MDNKIYSKLTSSGKAGFRQIRENFEDTLLEVAYKRAKENGTAEDEISLRDIFDARDIVFNRRRRLISNRFVVIGWSSLVAGLIYVMVGLFMFMNHHDIEFGMTFSDNGELLIILTGILAMTCSAILLISFIIVESRSMKDGRKIELSLRVSDMDTLIMQWQRIESLGNVLYRNQINKLDVENPSIDEIYNFINSILPPDYKNKAKNILFLRNSYVHGNSNLSPDIVNDAIKDSNDIIKYLSDKENHVDDSVDQIYKV